MVVWKRAVMRHAGDATNRHQKCRKRPFADGYNIRILYKEFSDIRRQEAQDPDSGADLGCLDADIYGCQRWGLAVSGTDRGCQSDDIFAAPSRKNGNGAGEAVDLYNGVGFGITVAEQAFVVGLGTADNQF